MAEHDYLSDVEIYRNVYIPTTSSLRFTLSPGSKLYPEVDAYADLPAASAENNGWVYLVLNNTFELIFFNTHPAGLYVSNGTTWDYIGPTPAAMSDNVFKLYDGDNITKQMAFNLENISMATTRILTMSNYDQDLTNPNFDSIQFNLTPTASPADGLLQWNAASNALQLSDIKITEQSLGSPTYSTINDFCNSFGSCGRKTGGTIADAGSSTVSVAAGTGFIKATDDDNAQLMFFDWPAPSNISIPANSTRYIGVEYNSGTPQVVSRTSYDWNLDTEFPLGMVVNETINSAEELYVYNTPWWVTDGTTNVIQALRSFGLARRDESIGGLILSQTGTRNIAVSGGVLWSGLNETTFTALDTSVSGSFEYYWYSSTGGWQKSDATQYSVTNYNDITQATLQPITVGKYLNIWCYLESGNSALHVALIYPQTQFNNAAQAEAETPPTNIPPHILNRGLLLGRIIIKQGTDAPTAVETAFGVAYSASVVTSHNNLSDLQLAASAVTYGHIDDQAQTIAGAKTFSSAPIISTLTAGSVLFAGATSNIAQDNASLFFNDTQNALYLGTNTQYASGANYPAYLGLGAYSYIGTTSMADNADKIARFVGLHYDLDEEPVAGIQTTSTSTQSYVLIGGGSSVSNAATKIDFYTAANNVTTTGTLRMRLDENGNFAINSSTPVDKFEIRGATDTEGSMSLTRNDTSITSANVLGKIQAYSIDGSTNGTGECGNISWIADSDFTGHVSYGRGSHLVISLPQYGIATTRELFRFQDNGFLKISPYQSGIVDVYPQGANYATWLRSTIATADDTGTIPAIKLVSQESNNSAISTRPVFGVFNYDQQLLTITSAGYVGIGINSPKGYLEVESYAYVSRVDSAATIRSERINTSRTSPTAIAGAEEPLGYLYFAGQYDTTVGHTVGGAYIVGTSEGAFSSITDCKTRLGFYTNNGTATAERMRITSDGFVGMGTNAPDYMLHISGTTPIIQLTDTTTGADCQISANTSDGSLVFSADVNNEVASSTIKSYIDGTIRSDLTTHGLTVYSADTYGLTISSTSRPFIRLYPTTTNRSSIAWYDNAASPIWSIESDLSNAGSSKELYIYNKVRGEFAMFFESDTGHIGINTNNPTAALDIKNKTGESAVLALNTFDATGDCRLDFRQNSGRRSYIQHADSGDTFQIASEYGGIALYTGTGGSEVLRQYITSDGYSIFGGGTAVLDIGGTGSTPIISVAASAANSAIMSQSFSNTTTSGALAGLLVLAKSGNTTIGTLTTTADTNGLGYIFFEGVNGSSAMATGASIQCKQAGAAGANYIGANLGFFTATASAAATEKLSITSLGNVVLGNQSALATNAKDGFAYIPTCAGTPTGVPTAYTGKCAMVMDTTNHKLYVYDGSWLAMN